MPKPPYRTTIDEVPLADGVTDAAALEVAAAWGFLSGAIRGDESWGVILIAVAAAFFVWPLVSTGYEIRAAGLVARSGPWRWTVPLAAIQGVAPAREWKSAPALSLDRLRIDYLQGGKAAHLLVSPADRSAFLRDLLAATPGLAYAPGGRLRREDR
jgi:hypothetical protein